MTVTRGFIGAGHMAEAIARAAVTADVLKPDRMIAADPSEARRAAFEALGVATTTDNAGVVEKATHVLMAVKPQVMEAAAQTSAQALRDDQVVISIMAGVNTARLAQAIGRPTRIVRVMPNTPMMVGKGMAGVALGEHARPGDEDLAMRLFGSGDSRAIRVDESTLDAITAVSGSGPAYVFYLAEAMEMAAEELGLGEHSALLVSQTLLGAATLLAQSEETPAELRHKVTSPGGTTEAAIRHLDANKTLDVIVNAVKAAKHRSVELGRGD